MEDAAGSRPCAAGLISAKRSGFRSTCTHHDVRGFTTSMPRRASQKQAARKPAPKRAPTRPAKKKIPRQKALLGSGRELWHPVFHTKSWVPRSLALTPCIRLRDTNTFSTGLTTGLNYLPILIQPMTGTASGAATLACNLIGRFGAGATAGTAGTPMAPAFMGAIGSGRARLHRLAVTLSCTGATVAGALLPTSIVKFGALRQPLDPASFPTWADLATHLMAKSELHTATAYSIMTKPVHVASFPVDVRDWESYKEITTGAAIGAVDVDDTMATIAILIGTAASGDQFHITVHSDWDVLLADDGNANLVASSAAVTHPSLPQSIIERATAGALEVAGVFDRGVELAHAAYTAYQSARQAFAVAPRAVRAIETYSRGQLALPY